MIRKNRINNKKVAQQQNSVINKKQSLWQFIQIARMQEAKQQMQSDKNDFSQIIKQLQAQKSQNDKATSQFNRAVNQFEGKIPSLENKIKQIKRGILDKQKKIQKDQLKLQRCNLQKQKIQEKLDLIKENDNTGLLQEYQQCALESRTIRERRKQLNDQIKDVKKDVKKEIQKHRKQIKLLADEMKQLNKTKEREEKIIGNYIRQLRNQKQNYQSYEEEKVKQWRQNCEKIKKQVTPLTDSQRIQIVQQNIGSIIKNKKFIQLMKEISRNKLQISLLVKNTQAERSTLLANYKLYTQRIEKINSQLKNYFEYSQLLQTLKIWSQIEDNQLYCSFGLQIQKKIHLTLKFEEKLSKNQNNKVQNTLQKLKKQQKQYFNMEYFKKVASSNLQQANNFLSKCGKNTILQRVFQLIPTCRDSRIITYTNFLQILQQLKIYFKKKNYNILQKHCQNITRFIQLCNLANFLATKNILKASQIAAFCQLIYSPHQTNKFCQIKTGEGKTVIVSMVAVFQCLKGYKVDIVTSNQVLAKDGAQFRKKFYSIFGLGVDHNNRQKLRKQRGLQQSYGKNIVYGTISNFQFDWLDHHCNLANTFGQRHEDGHQIVIIDQVDNIVLDKAGDCAKMSDSILGMEDLKFLFIEIWLNLCKLEQDYQKKDYRETKQFFIRDRLQKSKDQFLNKYPLGRDFYSTYRQQNFAKWVKCAIDARYNIHENQDYIVQKSQFGEYIIIPLDRQIGCTLDKTIWTHLHPFVQLEHKLQITPDSFVTMFISNWGYIMEYRRIYGVTGTLGSKQQQSIIRALYKAETSKIPPFLQPKIKNHGRYFYSQGIHYLKITQKAIQQCQRRPVLIISQTVKDLQRIKSNIQNQLQLDKKSIEIYVYQDQRDQKQIQQLNEQGMKRNQILIATNIGGRGTDLRLDPLALLEGGLYQITTYMPQNIRIELQATGRAARNGQPGQSILIACLGNEYIASLNLKTVPIQISQKVETKIYQQIQKIRDKKQAKRLQQVKLKVKELQEQKMYFQRFLSYLKIFVYFKTNRYIIMDIKTKWGLLFGQWEQNKYTRNKLQNFFQLLQQLCYNLPSMMRQYRFMNPYFSLKYVESLLSEDQKGVHAEMTESEKIKYSCELLKSSTTYMQYPFRQQIYNGVLVKKIQLLFKNKNEGKISTMILNTLSQFFRKNSSNSQNSNIISPSISQEQINTTLKALNRKIDYLSKLICMERIVQYDSKEQNYLLKHLECQAFVFTLERQNINRIVQSLRQSLRQSSLNSSYISMKEKYAETALIENLNQKQVSSNKLSKTTGVLATLISSLDEQKLLKDIYMEQLATLQACGGGTYVQISQILQISPNDPRIIRGVQYVALGLLSNLVGMLMPGLGQFIAAAAGGAFIKKGMDCIICAIFDEEPEQEQIIDMITDIALICLTGGIGSLPTIIFSCLKSFAKRFMQEKVINQLEKQLEQGVITPIKKQISQLVMPLCIQICQSRKIVYQMIRQETLSTVCGFLEDKIADIENWFYKQHSKSNQSNKLSIYIIDLIVRSFRVVEQKIADLMRLISQITSFIKKSFQFIKNLPIVISSLLKRLNLGKINFSKINVSNIITIIQLIQQFTKGDLVDEITNLIGTAQQIFMTLSNLKNSINRIKQNCESLLKQLDVFINTITTFQLSQDLVLLSCQIVKELLVCKISQKINLFLHNNPIQQLFKAQGFNLDDPKTLATNISSTIWGLIIGTIKSLIFKRVKSIQLRDSKQSINTCGFDAVASLLLIPDYKVIETATGIIQGSKGISLEEMKILLKKIGLINVSSVKVDGNYALQTKNYFNNQLSLNQSIGAIAAIRPNDKQSIGHMYAVKTGLYNKLEFVDRVKGQQKNSNQNIWQQRSGILLIPYGFNELKRKQIQQTLKTMKNQYSFTTGQLKEYLDLFGSTDNIQRSNFYPSHQDCKINIINKPFYKKMLYSFKKHLSKYTFVIESSNSKQKIFKKESFMIGAVCLIYREGNCKKKQYFITHSGTLKVAKKITSHTKDSIKTKSLCIKQLKKFNIMQNLDKQQQSLKNLQIQFVPSKSTFSEFQYNVFGEQINLTNEKLNYMFYYDKTFQQIICRTCAAQKALDRVGQFMYKLKQSDKTAELVELQMYETWYNQPGTKNKDYSLSEPAKSCKWCQAILPIITMKKQTYLQFQKQKTNGKEWNKKTK